jgi:hypothetical protein
MSRWLWFAAGACSGVVAAFGMFFVAAAREWID